MQQLGYSSHVARLTDDMLLTDIAAESLCMELMTDRNVRLSRTSSSDETLTFEDSSSNCQWMCGTSRCRNTHPTVLLGPTKTQVIASRYP